jgi:hypothetical protein
VGRVGMAVKVVGVFAESVDLKTSLASFDSESLLSLSSSPIKSSYAPALESKGCDVPT